MAITSMSFLLFVFAVIVAYYTLPKKYQWVVLLVFSAAFYLSYGIKSAGYVLITASSVYGAARLMQQRAEAQRKFLKEHKTDLSKEEKKLYREKTKKIRKGIMLAALLLNLGILAVFKYFHFALAQVNAVLSAFGQSQITDIYKFIVPLGISFYTFQSIGYLVDVYFEYYPAEKNYFKVLLFTSFFPQMTQGPISDFEVFSKELFSQHELTYKNYSWGLQRMVWGFVKKMIVADTLAPMVRDVFANYNQYTGVTTLMGAFMYSIQIYADFSGYMDIMCGICEVLGIRLTENFERPYFSKSIAEYWRRWHMSLGAWFKKYIYYTIGMSNWSRKMAADIKKKYGKHLGNTIPATVALIVVWTATGLWHGASWAYIAWGLVNGLFIIFSMWMEPVYGTIRSRLAIKESAFWWRAFQVIRTFILVTFIKVLPEVGTLSQGVGLWKRVLFSHTLPANMQELFPYMAANVGGITDALKYLLVLFCILLMIVFSLLQRKKPVRERFNKLPMVIRVMVLSAAVLSIVVFGVPNTWGAGGFLYANF